MIIVKVPTCLRNLFFGSVLLRWASCSVPGPSYGYGSLSLGFFIFLLLLSAALLKVWCRQSKVNRLFNLFSPCQETLSCEITEQELRLRSHFENSHGTFRLAAASARALLVSAVSPRIQTRRQTDQSSLTLQKKTRHHLKKGLLKAQLMPWPCSYYSKGCVENVWKRPGDHSRTIMLPPGSLLQEGGKKAGLAALGHDSPHGHFVGEPVKNQPTGFFVCWSSSLLHLRQIFCVSLNFLQHKRLQSPSSRIFR